MFYTDAILNPRAENVKKRAQSGPPSTYSGGTSEPNVGGAANAPSNATGTTDPTKIAVPSGTSAAPGAAVAASAATTEAAPSPNVLTNIAGGSLSDNSPILPGKVPPVSPALQNAFLSMMQSQVGKGVAPFPGALSPNVGSTLLPQAWASWQPDPAAMQNMRLSMQLGYPSLNNLMWYGAPGGAPGTPGYNNPLAPFLAGAPSAYKTPTTVG